MNSPNYYPYGKTLRKYTNGPEEKFLTTQHERDVETGLDYRGARFYDADVVRLRRISLDPHASNYPALSAYSYVAGNPMAFTDPSGKDVEDNGNETHWTENHSRLLEAFGDPYEFRSLIESSFQELPTWEDVFNNYPKTPDGNGEMSSPEVYQMVFGDKYDPADRVLNFSTDVDARNSCALRVSICLVRSGVDLPNDFLGSEGEFKGVGVVISSTRLKKHLTNTVFGDPTDTFDMSKMTPEEVRRALNGRTGIYFMTPKPGEFSTAVGHATIWTGTDVFGTNGHSYLESAAKIYF